MYITTTFVQTVAGLITLARCGSAKFTTPPELESGWPEDRDMGKNERYDSGDTIVIAWDTVMSVDLQICQLAANGTMFYSPMSTIGKTL